MEGDNIDDELMEIIGELDDVYIEDDFVSSMRKAERVFSVKEQQPVTIYISKEMVEYVRVLALMLPENETSIIRGLITYGTSYLYHNIFDDIKQMRAYECKLIRTNKFVMKVISQGIPSPVKFDKRERLGIRLVKTTSGALFRIAEDMHLNKTYVVELAMWTALKELFKQDETVNETFGDDMEFVKSLGVYDDLKRIIRGKCDDYANVK